MFTEIIGWICVLLGPSCSFPQIIRLLRHSTATGISLFFWQLSFTCALGWVFHGFIAHALNLIVANCIILSNAIGIIILVCRYRKLNIARAFSAPVIAAIPLFLIDISTPALVFGIAVGLIQAVSVLIQIYTLYRSRDVSGVSGSFLALSLFVQALWTLWGYLKPEHGILFAAGLLTVLTFICFVMFLYQTNTKKPDAILIKT